MKMKKAFALIMTTLVLGMGLSGCSGGAAKGNAPVSGQTQETQSKFVAGMLEQNSVETLARRHWTQAKGNDEIRKQIEYKPFTSLNTMLMEFGAGRVDFLQLPRSVANYLDAGDDALIVEAQESSRPSQQYHMAVRADDSALLGELNTAIAALKADGTLEQLAADYITNTNGPAASQLTKNEGAKTYVVAVTGDLPPLDYVSADGKPAGFNVALLNAISRKNGCNFKIVQMDAAARLSALESKKIDLVFWIGCWNHDGFEPETNGISLTTPYFEEKLCFVSYSTEVLKKIVSIYQNAN